MNLLSLRERVGRRPGRGGNAERYFYSYFLRDANHRLLIVAFAPTLRQQRLGHQLVLLRGRFFTVSTAGYVSLDQPVFFPDGQRSSSAAPPPRGDSPRDLAARCSQD